MKNKYKYRFKTENEFIEEFGRLWRDRVPLQFIYEMDFLLGEDVDIKYYDKLDNFFNCKYNADTIFNYKNTGFNISKEMVKKIELRPVYKKRKFVY